MEDIDQVVKRIWGYDTLLPLQAEAISAVLANRDSILILPTGGGKSLCYQAPAAAMGRLAVVVSPLISLMKDQVDGLTAAGVPAVFLNSSLTTEERRQVEAGVARGRYHLLYVAPERLVLPTCLGLLRRAGVAFFAIDEAHCISQWGHDFRPEYRQLKVLREVFPEVAIHAFTATATPRVRTDIAAELLLRDPQVLVGSFDRPNLVYRVRQRRDRLAQILEALEQHRGEAGIIYCIRRVEVDQLCEKLRRRGLRAVPYHAGLSDEARKLSQDDFISERADVVVATVAFGMGIDRSDVRYVIHAGMPKSIEHYQQEAGRAGRDGLPSECLLLYSGGDYGLWRSILMAEGLPAPGAIAKLGEMYDFCRKAVCRHRFLVEYFGQSYAAGNCGACDLCLGEVKAEDDSDVLVRQILACVVHLGERFGAEYVTDVLRGAETARIVRMGHGRLSDYGLLREHRKAEVRSWIEQLEEQGCLAREDGDYPTLGVTERGHRILRGEDAVRLVRTLARGARQGMRPDTGASGPEGAVAGMADGDLFEVLRGLRRAMAGERGIPPYLIFSDASLREMARVRPTTEEAFLQIKGVGLRKLQELGPRFLACIRGRVDQPRTDAPPEP
ncbi:MAG TPA: DNA helicase RecQ [Candidatus Methylomirabilis sp.]|nr:DNA helicase RecQ [Candidatus Methylomirabilis sp.]